MHLILCQGITADLRRQAALAPHGAQALKVEPVEVVALPAVPGHELGLQMGVPDHRFMCQLNSRGEIVRGSAAQVHAGHACLMAQHAQTPGSQYTNGSTGLQ